MEQLELPEVFKRYEDVGGCVEFVIFDNADATIKSQMNAISALLGPFNEARLVELGRKLIDKAELLGDWFDSDSGKLIRCGSVYAPDGRTICKNPTLEQYEKLSETKYPAKVYPFASFGGDGIEPGEGGQFAYAFFNTPHGLHTTALEIQSLFDQIIAILLPSGEDYEIQDWSNSKLPEISDWFECGMEWWGVFLFSIYLPNQKRLIAMVASTTD